VIVKICGITVLEDGLAALDAGAEMLGFNFYHGSPRFVAPDACDALVSALRRGGAPFTAVGVFVNQPPAEVRRIMALCDLDLAQLSGDEPPEDLVEIGAGRAFKAIRASGPSALEAASRYVNPLRASPPAILVDAAAGAGQYGGTGLSADHRTARMLASEYALLLAGGLRPDNVADAVRQVRPWGVDVASGVESSPGRKDPEKMRVFVRSARNAADHLPGRKDADERG
jgi:phosphoribosylanthranilate isomerase